MGGKSKKTSAICISRKKLDLLWKLSLHNRARSFSDSNINKKYYYILFSFNSVTIPKENYSKYGMVFGLVVRNFFGYSSGLIPLNMERLLFLNSDDRHVPVEGHVI